MQLYISKYCSILGSDVSINGELKFSASESSVKSGLTAIYRNLGLKYPKFFKMDELSKLGFLTSELLLQETSSYNQEIKADFGVFLSNSSSSLEIDRKHQSSIADENNYFPSPSVFVYTLPNIVIGEICIRHKIMGESSFDISKEFDAQHICETVQMYCQEKKLDKCIAGWLEYNEDVCHSFLFLVEREDDTSLAIPLDLNNLLKIYNKK